MNKGEIKKLKEIGIRQDEVQVIDSINYRHKNGKYKLKRWKIMPNFDRTGPRGKGRKTGRGLGKCWIWKIKLS